MRIAVITIFSVPNFGSVLQAYATQAILQEMGHDCDIINYAFPNEWYYAQGVRKTHWLKQFIYNLGILRGTKKELKLKKFRKKYYNFTPFFPDPESLQSYDWSKYDILTVGSDQVWNTRFTYGDPSFLLGFGDENLKRISIASSFACSSIPSEFEDGFRSYLSRFSAISVREKQGLNIICQQFGIDTNLHLCLYPTLLLSHKQWISAFSNGKMHKPKRPYILLYMWTYAFEPRPYIFEVIKAFQEKYGYDVIALEGYTSPKQASGIVMTDMSDSSIDQFMTLFDNASLVVTSSFHGTAFAVNFGKPVISIVPANANDDRQSSLLESVGANGSIVPVGMPIEHINPFYDKETVLANLERLRRESLDWITTALK